MDKENQSEEQPVDYSNLNQPEPMGSKNYEEPSSSVFQNPIKMPPLAQETTPQGTSPSQPQEPTLTGQPKPQEQEVKPKANIPNKPPQDYQSLKAPKPAWHSIVLIAFLALLIILAIFVFISWRGWVKIGFMEDIWKRSPSPELSVSPEATTSAAVNNNDLTRKSDLGQIKQALLDYYKDNGSFPIAAQQIKTSDGKTTLANALIPTYLDSLPDDPSAPTNYYGYKSDGKSFELTCVLENTSDPEGIQMGNYYIYKLTVRGE